MGNKNVRLRLLYISLIGIRGGLFNWAASSPIGSYWQNLILKFWPILVAN